MQVILNLASLFVMCIWTYLYVRNVSSLFTIISISINVNYYYDFIFFIVGLMKKKEVFRT